MSRFLSSCLVHYIVCVLFCSDGKLDIVVPSFVHYLEVLEGSDGDKMPGTSYYLFSWSAEVFRISAHHPIILNLVYMVNGSYNLLGNVFRR